MVGGVLSRPVKSSLNNASTGEPKILDKDIRIHRQAAYNEQLSVVSSLASKLHNPRQEESSRLLFHSDL